MINRRGYVITKKDFNEDQLTEYRNELTVSSEITSKDYNFNNEKFKIYKENKTHMILPRYYGIDKIGQPQIKNLVDGIRINLKFNGILNDKLNQTIVSKKTVDELESNGCGILSLPTGYGKTTIALHVISKMNTKTLIIVHKEFLMNQWIERIQQFLPDATVGIIQGNKTQIDKDIVVGMLQSISMKEYDKSLFSTFGMTIIDETHHICAKVFSQALFKISTKYMLGLSATPVRKDGLTKVLNYFMGNIFYHVERENKKDVCVNVIINKEIYKDLKFPLNRMGKICIPEAINKITSLDERTEQIIEIIGSIDERRNILILSDRRQHCFEIHEKLQNLEIDSGMYLGGMKSVELNESEQKRIIIATYSLAHEGLDIPKLDTLILATPKSDVIQSIGRILRENSKLIKSSPMIYDIVDEWGVFQYQFYKRLKFYKKTGFDINYA